MSNTTITDILDDCETIYRIEYQWKPAPGYTVTQPWCSEPWYQLRQGKKSLSGPLDYDEAVDLSWKLYDEGKAAQVP